MPMTRIHFPYSCRLQKPRHWSPISRPYAPGRAATKQPWQEVRNRAAVALMLGAGVTSGEVRALELDDVVVSGGRGKDIHGAKSRSTTKEVLSAAGL